MNSSRFILYAATVASLTLGTARAADEAEPRPDSLTGLNGSELATVCAVQLRAWAFMMASSDGESLDAVKEGVGRTLRAAGFWVAQSRSASESPKVDQAVEVDGDEAMDQLGWCGTQAENAFPGLSAREKAAAERWAASQSAEALKGRAK